MSLIKKLFGALAEKPWEKNQAVIDNAHTGGYLDKKSEDSKSYNYNLIFIR